jgi:hypothetical protein
MLGAAGLLLSFQDQSEWQIEWQNRARESLIGACERSPGLTFSLISAVTSDGRARPDDMVRRRSTVRFRKGAPQNRRSEPGSRAAGKPSKIA